MMEEVLPLVVQCTQQHNHVAAERENSTMAKVEVRKIARDAGTGRFIPLEEAKRRPTRTVVETVRVPTRKK